MVLKTKTNKMIQYLNISSKKILSKLINLTKYTYVQNGFIIKFKENEFIVRHDDELDSEKIKIFYSNSDILWKELIKLLNFNEKKKIYVASYECNWRQSNLYKTDLIANGQFVIRTNSITVLREIFYSSLKYQVFPVFVTEDFSLAVIPTDHLDLFVSYNDEYKNSIEIVSDCLEMVDWNF